jgi:trans-aconitate 2-methyltransferase
MWNPDLYLRFADERGRPFHELVARVGATEPRVVLDFGCGPGNLTETLPARWPKAQVVGVDSAPEMIAKARAAGGAVSYEVGDALDYVPGEEVDVIVSNAMLQWVPGHDEVLKSWVKPGRWIAIQVPGNYNAPGHLAMRALCESPRWAQQLGGVNNFRPVGDAVHFGRLLRDAGCAVDAWETTYIHQLPVVQGQRHPVLTWMSGTAMRPIRAVLDDTGWESFCDELERELWQLYPPHGSVVDFPFLRVFAVGVCARGVGPV